MIKEEIRPAVLIFVILTVITGILYPLSVTGIAQAFFPAQANGSLVYSGGKAVGSALIGQPFDDAKYFWGRVSATSPVGFNAASSSGSNLGPLNPALADVVKARIKALRDADPGNTAPVPVDLVTSSASGLDPHISLAAAYYQGPRVARARNMAPSEVENVIRRYIRERSLGFIGERVVNVLELNMALDKGEK